MASLPIRRPPCAWTRLVGSGNAGSSLPASQGSFSQAQCREERLASQIGSSCKHTQLGSSLLGSSAGEREVSCDASPLSWNALTATFNQ